MRYGEMKRKLTGLFDEGKLRLFPQEWGFHNTTDVQVKRIGYATNIAPEIIAAAANRGVDFLLTHHDAWPFLYGMPEACARLLHAHGMRHAFFHAPLDDADFGTAATLAKALCLEGLEAAIPYQDMLFAGRIGVYQEPVSFAAFAARLEEALGETPRCFQNNGKPLRKVCVTTGGGNMTEHLRSAVEADCDGYVTGEYSLYTQQYAKLAGLNLFIGSHTATEVGGVQALAALLVEGTDMEVVRVLEPLY